MKITKMQHSCFLIETEGKRIVLDPFSKNAVAAENDILKNPDLILLSHGHNDHTNLLPHICGEKTKIAACFELCTLLKKVGYKNLVEMNIGGAFVFDGLKIVMVKAEHSSSFAIEGVDYYAGAAAGFIIISQNEGKTAYFAGDTAPFADMSLINLLYNPTLAMLPIGDKFTMGIESAAFAANNFFDLSYIIPMHYDTFAPIKADTDHLAKLTKAQVIALKTTESFDL